MGNAGCGACCSGKREEIDKLLRSGRSVREVATFAGIGKNIVQRHKTMCLNAEVREVRQTKAELAVAAVEAREGTTDRRSELVALRSTVLRVMADHGDNPSAILACCDRLLRVINEDRAEDAHEAEDVLHPSENDWRSGALGSVLDLVPEALRPQARGAFAWYCKMNQPLETSPALANLTPEERRERILELLRRSDVLLPVLDTVGCRGAIVAALKVPGDEADSALSACLRERFKRVGIDDGIDRASWWLPRDGPVPGGGQPVVEDASTVQGEAMEGNPEKVAGDGVPSLLGSEATEPAPNAIAVQLGRQKYTAAQWAAAQAAAAAREQEARELRERTARDSGR